ncbi:hypothetical protein RB195_022608 [Necator americanus]|uniref:Uncharacterized protein n=1 Tax=Necator americanus TaxID=51031 RepID=A0ABR1EFY2_NECAM
MTKIDVWGSLEAEGKILIMMKPQHDATFSRMNKIDGWGSLEAEGKIFIMIKPQHDATFSSHEQNRWLGIFGGRGKNINNDEASTRRYLLNRMNKIDGWGSLEAEGKIFIMTKPQHDAHLSIA